MIDYDLAVSITNKYIIKRIDNDYLRKLIKLNPTSSIKSLYGIKEKI